jgi:hypothetical protein
MENITIEEKQEYLSKEILRQHFNGQAFLNFLIETKGESAINLENWSFEDLRDIVEQFKEKHIRDSQLSDDGISSSNITTSLHTISYINCLKSEKTRLTDEKLSIAISESLLKVVRKLSLAPFFLSLISHI